jgi:hypothetical protein
MDVKDDTIITASVKEVSNETKIVFWDHELKFLPGWIML